MSYTRTSSQLWSERWRLAALPPDALRRAGLASILVGLLYLLFHLQGNTTDIRMFGRSAILWMVSYWHDDLSYSWLIPFISAGVIWCQRKQIAAAPQRTNRWGLALVVLALLVHWMGAKAQQVRVSLFALVLLLWGAPLYLYGWQVMKHLVFPVAFLFFCIPLNFLDELTAPLSLLATTASTHLLNGLGIAVQQVGTRMTVNDGPDMVRWTLEVAAPCSGLRSIMALTILSAVYAYFTQKTLVRKWILFLASVPLAIVGNVMRIITISLMAQAFGQDVAVGLYHDYSGFIFFPVSLGLLIGLGGLLNHHPREIWLRWKSELLSPISS
ncbi:MAG TPA: exosortase/archaeosortase family protein [Kiritimatiellia bacterium]|nr:exosortase/archaeosortase family protein [Kiritimatiellia bacterium]HRZ12553.1 exosortase/archaeosortase family protein [Kiritimatiellia bacterium]HSA17631.1 exosortase/archaeosortase family protein [Kiritimatiellia bacterium]